MSRNLTPEEFRSTMWARPDPKPIKKAQDKLDYQKFWCLWVPLGAVIAFGLSLWADSGGVFLPAWFVASLLLWGISSGNPSE